MENMSYPAVALRAAAAGSAAALAIMAVIAVRAIITVTRGHRWYQLKNL